MNLDRFSQQIEQTICYCDCGEVATHSVEDDNFCHDCYLSWKEEQKLEKEQTQED